MPDVKLRQARPGDEAALTALSLRSKQSNGYDDAFMAACREELTVTPDHLARGEHWVAEAGELCGYGWLLANQQARTGEVCALFVEPTWKRKGIGRVLWQKLLARAKEQGLAMLHLDADPYAVPFYEAQGLRITGTSPSGSVPGREIPLMQIDL
ncbi:MAG: GNAT family N-acetyltransferase [Alphaproteobacteria bacterium]